MLTGSFKTEEKRELTKGKGILGMVNWHAKN